MNKKNLGPILECAKRYLPARKRKAEDVQKMSPPQKKSKNSKSSRLQKQQREILSEEQVQLPVTFYEFLAFTDILSFAARLTDDEIERREYAYTTYFHFYTNPATRFRVKFVQNQVSVLAGAPCCFYERVNLVPQHYQRQFTKALQQFKDSIKTNDENFFDNMENQQPSGSASATQHYKLYKQRLYNGHMEQQQRDANNFMHLVLQEPATIDKNNALPIKFADFKKFSNLEETIVPAILLQFSGNDKLKLRALNKVPYVNDFAMKNFYYYFYTLPRIRSCYELKPKNCPQSVRMRLLSLPEMLENDKISKDKSCINRPLEEHQTVSSNKRIRQQHQQQEWQQDQRHQQAHLQQQHQQHQQLQKRKQHKQQQERQQPHKEQRQHIQQQHQQENHEQDHQQQREQQLHITKDFERFLQESNILQFVNKKQAFDSFQKYFRENDTGIKELKLNYPYSRDCFWYFFCKNYLEKQKAMNSNVAQLSATGIRDDLVATVDNAKKKKDPIEILNIVTLPNFNRTLIKASAAIEAARNNAEIAVQETNKTVDHEANNPGKSNEGFNDCIKTKSKETFAAPIEAATNNAEIAVQETNKTVEHEANNSGESNEGFNDCIKTKSKETIIALLDELAPKETNDRFDSITKMAIIVLLNMLARGEINSIPNEANIPVETDVFKEVMKSAIEQIARQNTMNATSETTVCNDLATAAAARTVRKEKSTILEIVSKMPKSNSSFEVSAPIEVPTNKAVLESKSSIDDRCNADIETVTDEEIIELLDTQELDDNNSTSDEINIPVKTGINKEEMECLHTSKIHETNILTNESNTSIATNKAVIDLLNTPTVLETNRTADEYYTAAEAGTNANKNEFMETPTEQDFIANTSTNKHKSIAKDAKNVNASSDKINKANNVVASASNGLAEQIENTDNDLNAIFTELLRPLVKDEIRAIEKSLPMTLNEFYAKYRASKAFKNIRRDMCNTKFKALLRSMPLNEFTRMVFPNYYCMYFKSEFIRTQYPPVLKQDQTETDKVTTEIWHGETSGLDDAALLKYIKARFPRACDDANLCNRILNCIKAELSTAIAEELAVSAGSLHHSQDPPINANNNFNLPVVEEQKSAETDESYSSTRSRLNGLTSNASEVITLNSSEYSRTPKMFFNVSLSDNASSQTVISSGEKIVTPPTAEVHCPLHAIKLPNKLQFVIRDSSDSDEDGNGYECYSICSERLEIFSMETLDKTANKSSQSEKNQSSAAALQLTPVLSNGPTSGSSNVSVFNEAQPMPSSFSTSGETLPNSQQACSPNTKNCRVRLKKTNFDNTKSVSKISSGTISITHALVGDTTLFRNSMLDRAMAEAEIRRSPRRKTVTSSETSRQRVSLDGMSSGTISNTQALVGDTTLLNNTKLQREISQIVNKRTTRVQSAKSEETTYVTGITLQKQKRK